MKIFFISIILFSLTSCFNGSTKEEITIIKSTNASKKDNPYLLIGGKNFLTGYKPIHSDGTVNVVIEIPTGTVDKWEVEKKTGNMSWEFRNDIPRKIKYIGYPGNYGMIPQTLLPLELGGDGDPLDVIVLGPALERGTVVKAKLIGILKLLDGGEQDDKLIAVMEDTPFYSINSLEELNATFEGVTSIVETFFSNYKGVNEMKSLGFADENEAQKVLVKAIKAYKK